MLRTMDKGKGGGLGTKGKRRNGLRTRERATDKRKKRED